MDELPFHDGAAAACDDDVDLLVGRMAMAERRADAGLDALQTDADALAAERVAGEARLQALAEAAGDSGVFELSSSTRPKAGVPGSLMAPIFSGGASPRLENVRRMAWEHRPAKKPGGDAQSSVNLAIDPRPACCSTA